MSHPNIAIIDRFFALYGNRQLDELNQVLSEDVRWIFPGHNPLSGTKTGIDAVVNFFDAMGQVMGSSNVRVEKLVTGVNDTYVVEGQHIWTNRAGGPNLDHQWCVLWTIENGKITEGRHLAADQYAADEFFTRLLS